MFTFPLLIITIVLLLIAIIAIADKGEAGAVCAKVVDTTWKVLVSLYLLGVLLVGVVGA